MKKDNVDKKKQTKNKNKKAKKSSNRINLSNEIIIGLTPKQEEAKAKKKNIKKKPKATAKTTKKDTKKKTKTKGKPKTKTKSKTKVSRARINRDFEHRELNKVKVAIAKWTGIVILVAILLIIILRSSLFNIKEIAVVNNTKLTADEIISLSDIQIGMNMFEYSNKMVNKKLSQNPYIESASIKRSLSGTLTIDINERKPTYMLKFANAFVYINNQGYMLEITETPIEVPVITGFETPIDDIKEGNRLCVNDLMKLEDVIKIMNSANETSLAKRITSVDIR